MLPATGVVLVHDFCRAAGIDQQRLLELAEADVGFMLHRRGEPFGLLDDRQEAMRRRRLFHAGDWTLQK